MANMSNEELALISSIISGDGDTQHDLSTENVVHVISKGIRYAESNLNKVKRRLSCESNSDPSQNPETSQLEVVCKHWATYVEKLKTFLKSVDPSFDSDPSTGDQSTIVSEHTISQRPQNAVPPITTFNTDICPSNESDVLSSNLTSTTFMSESSTHSAFKHNSITESRVSSTDRKRRHAEDFDSDDGGSDEEFGILPMNKFRPSECDTFSEDQILQPVQQRKRNLYYDFSMVSIKPTDKHPTPDQTNVATMTDPGYFPSEMIASNVIFCGFFANPRESCYIQMPHEQLNQIASECIVAISAQRIHVTWDKVLNMMCTRLHISDLAHIGVRRAIDIPAISSLTRMNDRINLFMNAYKQFPTMWYDVDLCLAQLFGRQRFDDLCIGPLCRHPAVRSVFQIPNKMGTSIPTLTTADVLYYLQRFLSEMKLWNSTLNVVDFVDFLKKELRVDSPFDLGIRIRGFGASLSALKAVQRSRKNMLDHAREKLKADVNKLCQSEMARIKESLIEKLSRTETSESTDPIADFAQSQRHRYINMPATAVVVDILESCRLLFEKAPFYEKLRDFLYQIQRDHLLRKLFQLAICAGRLALPDDAVPAALKRKLDQTKNSTPGSRQTLHKMSSSFGSNASQTAQSDDDTATSDDENGSSSSEDVSSSTKRPKQVYDLELIECIRQSFDSVADMSSETLLGAEQRVIEKFGGAQFADLNSSRLSFLQFVHSHRLLHAFHQMPSHSEKLLHAFSQIPDINSWPDPTLEAYARHYFDAENARRIKQAVLASNSNRNFPYTNTIISPVPILGPTLPASVSFNFSDRSIHDSAVARLRQCPLLFNVRLFTHWKMLYESRLGSLRKFIQTNFIENFAVFEDPLTGAFLRLASDETLISIEALTSSGREALAHSNADCTRFVGCLLSFLLVKHRSSVDHMPHVLVSNLIYSVLATRPNDAPRFILASLLTLPECLLEPFGMRLFLEPFARLQGSMSLARSVLRDNVTQIRSWLVLEKLGLLHGFRDLTESFDSPPTFSSYEVHNQDMVDEQIHLAQNKSWKNSDSRIIVAIESAISNATSSNHSNPHDDETNEARLPTSNDDNRPPLDFCSFIESNCNCEVVDTAFDEEQSISAEDARDHVENIRRDKFGVGLDLSEDGMRLADSLRNLIGRSLDRLSKELYSCDMHFVLELIQNADDNLYTSGVVPQIRFEISEQSITVYNNEIGFRQQDVDAICDVGKSTKGIHRSGYIGHKGIGFKSVFAVSNRPEIHSSSYHIAFNVEKNGSVGYILPEWIAKSSTYASTTTWCTLIHLPLKSQNERERHRARSLASSFRDIQPTLLLFLNRLIEIQIQSNADVEYRFRRKSTELPSVAEDDEMYKSIKCSVFKLTVTRHIISSSESSQVKSELWLVIKQSLQVPPTFPQHSCVKFTDVAIALPMRQDVLDVVAETLDTHVSPSTQDVFAFLPIRSYGLPFIIQADFELPSHRQDIKEDSEWNQWILLQVPKLFIEAVPAALQEFTKSDRTHANRLLLHFLPHKDRVSGIFAPVANEIIRIASKREVIPCADGQVRMPSCTVLPDQHGLLLSEQIVNTYLGLHYIDPVILKLTDESNLYDLNVQKIDFNHLLDSAHALQGNPELAYQWLNYLAAILPKLNLAMERDLIDRFRHLTVVPLRGKPNNLIRMLDYDGVIFIPNEHNANTSSYDIPEKMSETIVYRSLHLVDRELLLRHSSDRAQDWHQIRNLLLKAGARQLVPLEIYKEHICRFFSSQNDLCAESDQRDGDVFIACTLFAFDLWKQDSSVINLDQLSEIVILKTNDGLRNPSKNVINFSKVYGNRYDLLSEFPDQQWFLIDSCYLLNESREKETIPIADRMKWRTFLHKLGVVDLLRVKRKQTTMTTVEFKSFHDAKHVDGIEALEKVIVDDWICKQFEELCTDSCANKKNNYITLFKAIEENWNSSYDQYKVATVSNSSGESLMSIDSTFFKQLKSLNWIPCFDDNERSNLTYCRAHETFIDCPHLKRLLADHVAYLSTEIDSQSLFAQDMGLITSMDSNRLISILKQWSVEYNTTLFKESSNTETAIPRMRFSFQHLAQVYEFLWHSMPDHQLRSIFSEHDLIFAGENGFADRTWFHWKDETCLIQRYIATSRDIPFLSSQFTDVMRRCSLSSFYPSNLKDFFIKICEICENPTVAEYVRLIELIVAGSNYETDLEEYLPEKELATVYRKTVTICEDTVSDIFRLFEEIGRVYCSAADKSLKISHTAPDYGRSAHLSLNAIESSTDPRKSITDLFYGKLILPTVSDQWMAPSAYVMLPDDQKLYDQFSVAMKRAYSTTAKSDSADQLTFLRLPTENPVATGMPGYNQSSSNMMLHKLTSHQKSLLQDILQIPTLSSSMVKEATVECPLPSSKLRNFVCRFVPLLQRYMLRHFPEQYEILNRKVHDKQSFADQLSSMEFYKVSRLDLIYRLKLDPAISISTTCQCALQRNEQSGILDFYVERSSHNDTREVLQTFASLFSCDDFDVNRQLCNFMMLLRDELENVENFARYQDFSLTLPHGHDVIWRIPKVEIIERADECDSQTPDPQKVQSFLSLTRQPVFARRPSHNTGSTQSPIEFKNQKGASDVVPQWPPNRPSVENRNQESYARNNSEKGPLLSTPRATCESDADTSALSTGQVNSVSADTNHEHVFPTAPNLEELSCEPLNATSVEVPSIPLPLLNQESLVSIGLTGERLVYEHLMNKYRTEIESGDMVIRWINAESETGAPYDLVIESPRTNRVIYVEVKSTNNEERNVFPISIQQLKLALQNPNTFEIYRIYNVNNGHSSGCPKLRLISDVVKKLENKTITLWMNI